MTLETAKREHLLPQPTDFRIAALGGCRYEWTEIWRPIGGYGSFRDQVFVLGQDLLPAIDSADIAKIAEITGGHQIATKYAGPLTRIDYPGLGIHVDFTSHAPRPSSHEEVPRTHVNMNGVDLPLTESVLIIKADSITFVGRPKIVEREDEAASSYVTICTISKSGGCSYQSVPIESIASTELRAGAQLAEEMHKELSKRYLEAKKAHPSLSFYKRKTKTRSFSSSRNSFSSLVTKLLVSASPN